MSQRARAVYFIFAIVIAGSSACQRADAPVRDPIPDIPLTQQRAVSRMEFDWKWPFSIGQGTLGCTNAAVVFRHDGKTYALNDAARSRGFALVDPIWRWQSGGWPSDPLRKLSQEHRETVFKQLMACEGDGSIDIRADAAVCKKNIMQMRGLTDPELEQIRVEGHERRWPPLKQDRASLDPLLEAGQQLCKA